MTKNTRMCEWDVAWCKMTHAGCRFHLFVLLVKPWISPLCLPYTGQRKDRLVQRSELVNCPEPQVKTI